MKTKTHLTLLAIVSTLAPIVTRAQPFDSGSNGSYGPLNVTNNTTLDLPPDGIFNCTTINISAGATLSFRRNPLNTPIYLLATGDVVINGIIDVSGAAGGQATAGQGGPGGFDGGQPAATAGVPAGDGLGPGAGRSNFGADFPGGGAFGNRPTANQPTDGLGYGNSLLVPLIGGSGAGGWIGNPGYGGGGGGGAILVASATRASVDGGIRASGGGSGYINPAYPYGAGSGGGIRLVAPIVAGNGFFDASGRSYGGDGRIRIDTGDRSGWHFTFAGNTTYGTKMFVFPPMTNRLDIVAAAGQIIPEGTPSGVSIELPVGASTNQTVTLQARGFTNNVPINVVVTPDNAASTTYSVEIAMTNNPSQLTVPVVIPAGQASRIYAWTR